MSIQTQTLLIKHFIVLVGSWYITSFINTLKKKKKALNLAEQMFSSAWKYLFFKVYNISPYCGIAMGLTAMGLVDLAMLLSSSTAFY